MENQINVGDQNAQQIGQNPVGQPIPIPEKPKINYLMIGGIILVCSAIFGIGGYYLGEQSSQSQKYVNGEQNQVSPTATPQANNPTPTTNPSSTPDLTSNWKTYEDSKYKFSFEYPLNYSFSNRADLVNIDELRYLTLSIQNSLIKIKLFQATFNDHIDRVKNSFQQSITLEKTLNENQSKLIEGNRYMSLESPPYPARVAILGFGGKYVLEIEQSNIKKSSSLESVDKNTFDQILSTFKFTN